MPIDQIDVGEPTTLRAVFTTSSGALADPTAITLTVTRPNGTVFATVPKAGLTTTGTGKWQYVVTPDAVGVWTYRFVSSGGVDSDQTEYFVVGAVDDDGPCDAWCMPDEIFGCPPLKNVAEASRDYVLARRCVDAASRMLFRRTKRRYPGICRATVRPCRRPANGTFVPYGWNSSWGVCSCGADDLRGCGCGGLSEVRLSSEYPILGIERVRVDGVTLTAGVDYRVDDGYYLVRLGNRTWPSCQDLSLDPATQAPTWEVTFWYGALVPADGKLAARALAAELYSGCTGGPCRLPHTMRSRSLQGISEDFILAADDASRFGVREVDWFLDSEEQAERNRPTVVASPDFLPTTRRVGTA